MTNRTPAQTLKLVVADLRSNGGRRIRHGLAWRTRRLRDRLMFGGGTHPGATRVVYSVDFGPNGDTVMDAIRDSGSTFGTRMFFGGSESSTARAVHIDHESVEPLLHCLLQRCGDIEIYVRVRGKFRRILTERLVGRVYLEGRSFDLLVTENVVGTEPEHVQCSRIEVGLWTRRTGPYRKGYYESDREFPIVGRLRTNTFDDYTERGHDLDEDFPTPSQPRFPIDVVYTWVDGDDPQWLEQKHKYSQDANAKVTERALRHERFRSRDELKYSLRSVELFAPWVQKIHIVTADQCPPWLDTDHPKINLVSHTDIYSNPDWLPTFNSSGIETQLHHIPGLARHFLYFNDDFFLGQLCEPSDFFHANGALKFFPSDQRAYEEDIDKKSEEYIQADKNAIELFKSFLPSVGREIMQHVPYASDRDLLDELEGKFPDEFAACASSRFRSGRDLRPIAFMQYHYGHHVRAAFRGSISHRYLALWKPSVVAQMRTVAAKRAHKTFCVADVGLQPGREEEVNEAVFDFLESYFRSKSSFER